MGQDARQAPFDVYGLVDVEWAAVRRTIADVNHGDPYRIVLGYAASDAGPWVKVFTVVKTPARQLGPSLENAATGFEDAVIEASQNIVYISTQHFAADYRALQEQESALIQYGEHDDIVLDWPPCDVIVTGRPFAGWLRQSQHAWALVADLEDAAIAVSGPGLFNESHRDLRIVNAELTSFPPLDSPDHDMPPA